MAPSKFEIYRDKSMAPCLNQKSSYDVGRTHFDNAKDLPVERVRLVNWRKTHEQNVLRRRIQELERENSRLRERVEVQEDAITDLQNQLISQHNPIPPNNPPLSYPIQQQQQQQHLGQQNQPSSYGPGRLSIVPRSLQPAIENQAELFGAQVEFPTVVHDWDTSIATRHIMPQEATKGNQTLGYTDKFTAPINNSAYIKENLITSTPSSKDDESRKPHNFNRRKSRPSLGGSPTLKLSPINETSRDCHSKSSSSTSSSATVRKVILKQNTGEEEDNRQMITDEDQFRMVRDLIEELEADFEKHEERCRQSYV